METNRGESLVDVIIIGAGGHARVIYEILSCGYTFNVVAFIDCYKHGSDEQIMDVPLLGDHKIVPELIERGISSCIIAVGDNKTRALYYEKFLSLNMEIINAIHPSSNIAHYVRLGNGAVVAAGVNISTGVRIGNNTIINTGATIEHETVVGNHVHIAPGCTVAGRVTVKDMAFVGIGSVIKENVTIGKSSIIGAGSVVIKDVPDNTVYVGAPARFLRNA